MAARLIGRVHSELERAVEIAKQDSDLTQQAIAEKLDINKATLSRNLNGGTNMTLKTLANLIWAVDGNFEFKIEMPFENEAGRTSNHSASDWCSVTTVSTPNIAPAEEVSNQDLTTELIEAT